jgi:hypothetical protein
MKIHHYLSIGIRFFAIWLFLYSIPSLVYFIENVIYGTVSGTEASLFMTGSIYLPWVFAAFILWKFSVTIAKTIIPPESDLEPESISPGSLLTVFVSVISIFFLYRATMDGVYWVILLNLNENEVYASLNPEDKASIIATLIEFSAAAFLLVNSRKISLWASKF